MSARVNVAKGQVAKGHSLEMLVSTIASYVGRKLAPFELGRRKRGRENGRRSGTILRAAPLGNASSCTNSPLLFAFCRKEKNKKKNISF